MLSSPLNRLAFVLAVLFLSVCAPHVEADDVEKPKDQFFDSDGVKIRYQMLGKGEPVVLVHGFTASIEVQWGLPGVFNKLARDYQVIAMDARGHGKSGKPHDPKQYGTKMVDDVIRLMDHLKIPQAHIVGYSMGGFISNYLRAHYPDRCITLTLGGAGWKKPNNDPLGMMHQLAESLEAGKGITPLLERLNSPGRLRMSPQQIRTVNATVMLFNDQKALAACVRGMAELSVLESELVANKVPTLALIGDQDPLKRAVDDLAKVLPKLTVKVIDNCDHITCFFSPKFAEELQVFLSLNSLSKNAKEIR